MDWRNPHVHVFLNVKDAKGAVLNWAVEIESPIDLESNGWNKETLQPGDSVTVRGILARNDSRQVWGTAITLSTTGRQVLKFTPKMPTEPLEKRPTPRWADKQPRLGPNPGGVQGYWAYPTTTVLQEAGANVKMDQWGLLANIADASKVAPMQPWALALYRNRQSRFLQDDPDVLELQTARRTTTISDSLRRTVRRRP